MGGEFLGVVSPQVRTSLRGASLAAMPLQESQSSAGKPQHASVRNYIAFSSARPEHRRAFELSECGDCKRELRTLRKISTNE